MWCKSLHTPKWFPLILWTFSEGMALLWSSSPLFLAFEWICFDLDLKLYSLKQIWLIVRCCFVRSLQWPLHLLSRIGRGILHFSASYRLRLSWILPVSSLYIPICLTLCLSIQLTSHIDLTNCSFLLCQISPTASSPSLSNRKRYPSFFRIIPSETLLNPPYVSIMRYFNWTRVATIHQNHELFALVSITCGYMWYSLHMFCVNVLHVHVCMGLGSLPCVTCCHRLNVGFWSNRLD